MEKPTIINLQPSRLVERMAVLLGLSAALGVLIAGLPAWAKVLLLLLLAFNGYGLWGQYVSLTHPKATIILQRCIDDSWILVQRDGQTVPALLKSSSRVFYRWQWLVFQPLDGGWYERLRRWVVLSVDSASVETLRRLRVYLNVGQC